MMPHDKLTLRGKGLDYSLLRAEARRLLTGKWNACALMTLIVAALSGTVGIVFGNRGPFSFMASPLSLLVGAPLNLGVTAIYLKLHDGKGFEYEEIFQGFRDFTRAVVASLLISLYVMLWSLLLIVPGIIAALGYGMTYFILVENPGMPATEAMRQSKRMMNGHKTELLMLGLSFIGWFVLSVLTGGIGFFWLVPYASMSFTIFYRQIQGISLHDDETVTGIIR
jgi:uncharacterized membrane protein